MYKKFKKGFTLVELIVVMAIIAILSTVAVVSYSAIVKKAEQSKVDSELAQIVNVLRAEAAETETVKDIVNVDGEELTEELTLMLSENGGLQFAGESSVVNDEIKLNKLFDDLLKQIKLGDYTEKLYLDLDPDPDLLVYEVETVRATLDVVVVINGV